jgi:hypothetical protein
MNKSRKTRAPASVYISPKQLCLECFQTPFEQHLNKKNRWVLADTSESWIASIFLVLNLVKLAKVALPCLLGRIVKRFSANVSQFIYPELKVVVFKRTVEA